MDDKIKAYVKNNIRKTAQTYLKIAKQPIEQAKFIGSVGREVAKAPAFLGKTAATGLIKIPTQVATNGRVDLAKNKYIGKAFMTDKQINQVSATPTAPLKFLGQNVLAGAKTAATAFGAPAMATRQGLTSLGASSLLGGGLNKAMGQDARQGAVQGAALAPTIAGITRYSNPLIEQGVAKFAPRIAGKMPNIIKEGIARVPGNVIEGAAIDATLGRRPLSLGSAAIDAATAFIPGNPNVRKTANSAVQRESYRPILKEDKPVIVEAVQRLLENNKWNDTQSADYNIRFRDQDEQKLRTLAETYVDVKWAKKAKIQDIAQELINRVRDEDNFPTMNLPSMGLMAGQKATGYPTAQGKFSATFDKKPRFEIDDSKAKLKPSNMWDRGSEPSTLNEVIDHPELFRNYPELANLRVRTGKLSGNTLAGYDPKLNEIVINSSTLLNREKFKNLKSTLLHEIQHVVQKKENFARGGQPTDFTRSIQKSVDTSLTTNNQRKIQEIWGKAPKDVQDAYDKYLFGKKLKPTEEQLLYEYQKSSGIRELRNQISQNTKTVTPTEQYFNLGGELESRSVANRADLTPEQRRITLPYKDQGIKPEDVITRFDDGGVQGSVEGGQFKAPYKPGDIKKLKDYQSELLGSNEGRSTQKYSRYTELKYNAEQGNQEAKDILNIVDDLDNQIKMATDAKNGFQPQIQKEVGGVSNEFYIRNGSNELVRAENAKPVDLGIGIDTFSHRFGKGTGVVISEAKTGMQIATGKNEKEAILNAQKAFSDLKGITPQELIDRQIKSMIPKSDIIEETDGGIGRRIVGDLNTDKEAIPHKEVNRFGSRRIMQGANPSAVKLSGSRMGAKPTSPQMEGMAARESLLGKSQVSRPSQARPELDQLRGGGAIPSGDSLGKKGFTQLGTRKLKIKPQPQIQKEVGGVSDIKSKKFVPSTKFQEVPEGIAVPPGGTYKMNMATGKTEAKWDNPPPTSPPKVKVKDSKYAFNINKNRLNMNKGQTKAFEKQVKQALPELEKVKGKKLTFDEVAEEAQKADLFKKAVGREATANFEAQLTATRNRMVELNTQIDKLQKGGDIKSAERLTLELIQHIKSVSGAAADTGRRLGSFRITAEARPFREQLLGEIIKNQKYSDDQAEMLVKAAAGVDFNDPTQVSKFFKEVIKPSVGKMLEEYRYINLLSSPRTHITNIFSNAIQTGVLNPATKLTTGIVDPIASALTGKARENYIGEVPMYYRGMLGSFPDAFTSLKEVFQGKRALTNLDFKTLQRMPSKGNVITKSLEGFDVFFRTLIEGGEKQALDYKFGKMGKEAGEGVINNIAEQRGQYYTFRQGFDNPGQGAALDWFDKGTQAVMQLRRVPGVSWFVPFIQTPMNIVKQGFEYSPAGFSTMVKADNKTEQFSKALLGSAVFAGAGYMALNDRLTYAAPRDPEQKKLFYASGKQPYSVKVGDKWVSFSKIGPLAYPLALAGAIKYSFEDNPSAVTDDTFEKTTKALTGAVGFFADQSYMQGIGNMIKGLEGQEGYTFSKIAGNVATQYVPLASLQRWVNNIIDPIYRKPKGLVENIKSSLIGQTGDMGYYEDPLGDPSKRQFPLQNAFSPVGITQENPQWNPLLDMRQQELQGNAILNQQEKDLQEKVGLNPASADSGDTKMDAYTAKMQEKMARNRVELLGEPERIGDKIIYQTDSGTSTLDLGKVTSLSEDNKYLKAIKNSKAFALADDIIESNLSDEVKNQALSDIGINRDDAEYYSIASQSNDLKSIYLLEVAQAFVNNSGNRQDMIDVLVSQRRKVNGDMIASDGVLDNLYNDGYITNEERKALKDIDFDAEGKLKVKPSSGGKKLKAVKAPTYKLSRKARQKLRKPKLASIKLEGSKKLKTTKPKKFAPIKLVNSKK